MVLMLLNVTILFLTVHINNTDETMITIHTGLVLFTLFSYYYTKLTDMSLTSVLTTDVISSTLQGQNHEE